MVDSRFGAVLGRLSVGRPHEYKNGLWPFVAYDL
jgi:hypothetical protein